MKNGVFWDVTPYGSCKNRRFGGIFLHSVRRLLVTANIVLSSPILVILMNEALSSSETSVFTKSTRGNISQKTAFFIYGVANDELNNSSCVVFRRYWDRILVFRPAIITNPLFFFSHSRQIQGWLCSCIVFFGMSTQISELQFYNKIRVELFDSNYQVFFNLNPG
jgi:hypothetical protein